MGQSVNITKPILPQLEMLKNEPKQEVEFLSTSIAQVMGYRPSTWKPGSVNVLKNKGKASLVPLTSSVCPWEATRCGTCTHLWTRLLCRKDT
uniref:Uncharacterized protein n=1 Tax=Neovison vison TaxID=452646 RepID=A0A8C7ETK6_NEOVI